MKKTLIHTLASICLILPATCWAQEENLTDSTLQEKISRLQSVPSFNTPEAKENPRGVYKLMGLLDKYNTFIKEPFDQYKICTDSVTLMMAVSGNRFSLGRNDSRIFNYTGEAPDPQDSTATRIYNSNQQHFTLKWWSSTSGHLYYPNKDWCTEYYEADKYSEPAKIIFDALMAPNTSDKANRWSSESQHARMIDRVAREKGKANPFIGAWRAVGMMDEMRDVKKELQRIHEEDEKRNPRNRGYHILTPTHFINTTASGGTVHTITYHSKKSITIGPSTYNIIWLNKDRLAIEIHEGFHTDYEIWERISDTEPVFNQFASTFVN